MKEILEKANYCLNCISKPCSNEGCPLNNDIPAFIKCVKEENYEQAYKVLCKTTVLQPICGRICPHMSQCMGSCVRGIKGNPVSIGELEALVGDMALKNNYAMDDVQAEPNGKKIAVIGSGPAGLTCSAFLARSGFEVTIFEKHDYLGGILKHGIPEFRLDSEILNSTINKIINLGIKVEYNKELGNNLSLEELQNNFDAVFISIGANIPWKMGIDGEELNGVYGGNSLLENNLHPNYESKKVAVIGGGNVAMDCARTIKKLGAEKVTIIYRRAKEQMPAEAKEIEDAEKEGIEFLYQTNVVKIFGDENNVKVNKLECIKTELVKKEGDSRLSPVDIEGSNFIIDMDYVVMAIGSTVDEKVVNSLGVEVNKKGYIQVNENYETSIKNVYAGGDVVGTKATVAWAAKTGRDVAEIIKKSI
jgi:glutamate synthase (NADPH/NADH) small chain